MFAPTPASPASTVRFSNRVENYVKYRPGYPSGVIATLISECGFSAQSIVADLGSGTGLLSELLLQTGARVFGVEPNREMREAGERLLNKHPRFTSVIGTAEATTLPDQSVDFITAAQAFHWFDRPASRREFSRILKPQGWVVLIWNTRRTDTSPFLRAYEELLQKFSTDYSSIDHRNITDDVIAAFYAPQPFKLKTFENHQVFDFEGVRGRLLSSSYAPAPSQPNHGAMLAALRTAFDQHHTNGQVVFDYITQVYYGQL